MDSDAPSHRAKREATVSPTVPLLLLALASSPSPVRRLAWQGARFDVVELSLDEWDLSISWTPGGRRLGQTQGEVRTNAGIFEPGYVPTGVLIDHGVERHPLQRGHGQGNFYLLPNGVFALAREGATITPTQEWDGGTAVAATQSGPLLVLRGKLHPEFREGSTNRVLRSAVGVRDARHVVLVMSRDEVNFWTLATLFRDELKCNDALYLDGFISALWAADAGLDDELKRGPFAGLITATRRPARSP